MDDEADSNKDPYARMRPSPRMPIACLYCGGGNPWFWCNCFRAIEARDGKRRKPKFDPRTRIYTLDPEAATNSWLAKQLPVSGAAPIVSSEVPALAQIGLAVSTEGASVSSDTDRKAYMRHFMRKRRAAEREKKADA